MLSYKEYRLYQESLALDAVVFNKPQILGVIGTSGVNDETAIEEAKMKKKKMDADTGDGEVVDASSEKDEPHKCSCQEAKKMKKSKKMCDDAEMPSPVDDAAVEDDEDEDEDEDEMDSEDKGEPEADVDAEIESDDESEEEPEVDPSEKVMFMKKKSKKKMKKESAGNSDSEMETWLKMYSLLQDPYAEFKNEDFLLTPVDTNPEANVEPQPGQVGYSPDHIVGQ